MHAGTVPRFEDAYRGIADALQLPGRHDPKIDVRRLVCDWLRNEENGQWLMILDNADDIDIFYHRPGYNRGAAVISTAQEPLASFLPQSSNGMILVTSRSRDAAARLTGNGWNVFPIPAMGERQAE